MLTHQQVGPTLRAGRVVGARELDEYVLHPPIVELARDRGQKSVFETPPETTAPSPVATHAAGASVSRQAAIPPSDEPEEDAMPWAGVISHATGDQTGTHATG